LDLWLNLLVMLVCYGYILVLILVSSRMGDSGRVSKKTSRKFLHAMIGNLPLIMPFFTDRVFPFLVAAPFILVTFLVSPYSPLPELAKRLSGLAEITEEGHHTGLVLYAVSYSILALLYGVEPYVVAAGIFPMAYGDSSAAIIGERFGAHRYRLFEAKSLEGSLGMLTGSLLSLLGGMLYFSLIYGFSFPAQLAPCLAVATVATVAEALSPRSMDNLSVPLLGALTFIAMGGGP
jgi:phytol kinase